MLSGEIGDLYAMHGAIVRAETATVTKVVIYRREVIDDLDGFIRAIQLAFFTADTAACAFFARDGAFFFV